MRSPFIPQPPPTTTKEKLRKVLIALMLTGLTFFVIVCLSYSNA